MLSNELILIILIFLAYLAIWFASINKVMEFTKIGISNIHTKSAVDYLAYNINLVCMSAKDTTITLKFNKKEVFEVQNNNIIGKGPNDINAEIKCNIIGDNILNGQKFKITKITNDSVEVKNI